MPKFQIACVPGHRASEHLFVIKSVFLYYQTKNKGLILSSFDIMTFFDSENIYDCMNELYNSKVTGKVYRLLFEMNRNVSIKVKTPVGMTESKEVDPLVSQESVEAALLSGNSIGKGIERTFTDETKEVKYTDELTLAPITYMDDIARLAEDKESAQYANDKLEDMLNSKGLSFNLDKSNFLSMGNKKSRKIFEQNWKLNP